MENCKMYYFDNENCEIKLLDEPTLVWCVFVYSSEENTEEIYGQCPLMFNTFEAFSEYITNPKQYAVDKKRFDELGHKVVIRQVDMVFNK